MSSEYVDQSVLILTVGTGNVQDLERSLYAPLLKSVRLGQWQKVILLPSQETKRHAEAIRDRIPDTPVEVCPIRGSGNENHADACFAHFDSVLGGIISDGHPPASITLDFTRGTKAMSAALVLAGVGRRIPVLRYIQGDRDPAGAVLAGTEEIREVRTEAVSARQRLDLAEELMERGDFEAVCVLLDHEIIAWPSMPELLRCRSKAYRAAAEAFACWDRFDYTGAVRSLAVHREDARHAQRFAPTESMVRWVERLSHLLDTSKHEEAAQSLRFLACDMLASAERRMRDGHREDAAIRCYRVLELVGQFRLFDQGLDSGALPCDHEHVESFQAYLKKKKAHPLRQNTRKDLRHTVTASRLQVARFLKHLKDPFGKKLVDFDDKHIKSRNVGILIHGYVALASQLSKHEFSEHMQALEGLLLEDNPRAEAWLADARSLNFSRSR